MSEVIQQALRRLKLRLSSGEIDEASYDRLKERILADLSPQERAAIGTGTPAPQAATPSPVTPSRMGPSGGSGHGLRTSIPSLADLGLRPGSVLLGQWRLVRELGRGGFGAVFEAEELHLHERQAIKVLDPAMVAKEELLSRFRREVSLMRKLQHPRIVRVFDYREDPRELIALISMQLVPDGSVKQLLATARARETTIPIDLALEILVQTLEALEVAHAQGVIHRDVTPGNVLLAGGTPEELLAEPGRDPQVKLVDFGIAALVERSALSKRSQALGTAAYAAPEMLDPSAEVTPAADVYGAGAIAYELLTGQMAAGRFETPSELRPEIWRWLDETLMSVLSNRPKSRPAAGEAARRLRERLRHEVRRRPDSGATDPRARETAVSDPANSRRNGNDSAWLPARMLLPWKAWGAIFVAAVAAALSLNRWVIPPQEAVDWQQEMRVGASRATEIERARQKEADQEVARRQRYLEGQEAAAVEQKRAGAYEDRSTGLRWTVRDNGTDVAWKDAKAYCENLDLEGAGHWSLPSLSELEGLLDTDAPSPDKIRRPLELTGAWVWSAEKEPFRFRAPPGGPVGRWAREGLFDDIFVDGGYGGRAICVRRPEE